MICNKFFSATFFLVLVTTKALPMFVDECSVPIASSSSSSSSSSTAPAQVVFPSIAGQQPFLFPQKPMIILYGEKSCRCKISLAAANISPRLRNMMDDCVDPVDRLPVPFSKRTLSIIVPLMELLAKAREHGKSKQDINNMVLKYYESKKLTAADCADIKDAFDYLDL